MQKETREMKSSEKLKDYITRIVDATRYPKKDGVKMGRFVEWGGSPRAGIALYIGSKADAYLRGDTILLIAAIVLLISYGTLIVQKFIYSKVNLFKELQKSL